MTVESRPSRARGLKLLVEVIHIDFAWSRPSRARGLKLIFQALRYTDILVAPLAGAWVETGGDSGGDGTGDVAPLAGAWVETIS